MVPKNSLFSSLVCEGSLPSNLARRHSNLRAAVADLVPLERGNQHTLAHTPNGRQR